MIGQLLRKKLRELFAWAEMDPNAGRTGYRPTSGPAHPRPPQAGSATSPRPGAGEAPNGAAPKPTASPSANGTGAKPAPKIEWCGCELTLETAWAHSVQLTKIHGKLHARRICLTKNKVQDTRLERVAPARPQA